MVFFQPWTFPVVMFAAVLPIGVPVAIIAFYLHFRDDVTDWLNGFSDTPIAPAPRKEWRCSLPPPDPAVMPEVERRLAALKQAAALHPTG